jgi:pimeloyl-ACP methyl ester carboxylesterase
MEFVEVDGLRLRVGTHGAGEPLLLLTGIGANIEMWGPLAGRLPGRQLIAVDVPGTGGSSTPRRPLRMPGYARIVERVLDGRGCPSVDVLGYSWGGALAQPSRGIRGSWSGC